MAGKRNAALIPMNAHVRPLLTDFYQITMAYSYWKAGKHNDRASFDLFFRKSPFDGEFTIFAGLHEAIAFLETFPLNSEEIEFIRENLPASCEPEFFEFMATVDCREVEVEAMAEGSVAFPRVPLLRISGPLLVTQLIESPLLNLVNYASLVATNAARHRLVAGPSVQLFEFGLRRAQGPDGALSASRYSFLGGFDGTSNVASARLFGIPLKGTHSHSFVSSYTSWKDIRDPILRHANDSTITVNIREAALKALGDVLGIEEIRFMTGSNPNESELVAFCGYAQAFPHSFLALIDTYNVVASGLPNFLAVAVMLLRHGYRPLGIRLDSGDLAYLSNECRKVFSICGAVLGFQQQMKQLHIVASNDIQEDIIVSLNEQGHSINAFGIGTHLVTCHRQPALGGVYKLVEINREPRIKLSEDISKVSIPKKKIAYRLYGRDGHALLDLLMGEEEPQPRTGERILCRHPFSEAKRAYVIPSRVEKLHNVVWKGELVQPLDNLEACRKRVHEGLNTLRADHLRYLNPTPYKVSVSDSLYSFIHHIWLSEAPIGELY